MRTEERLEQALREATALPVKYYEYGGTAQEYIVYNEEAERPANYGDNAPLNRITWWQVHLFAPKAADFRSYKRQAESALRAAGFQVADIATLYEAETKTIHVCISCSMGESEE